MPLSRAVSVVHIAVFVPDQPVAAEHQERWCIEAEANVVVDARFRRLDADSPIYFAFAFF
jgi:hypothetical protein